MEPKYIRLPKILGIIVLASAQMVFFSENDVCAFEVEAKEMAEEKEEDKSESGRDRKKTPHADNVAGGSKNFFEIAIYAGENFNVGKSEYSRALEDYNTRHGWKQDTQTFFPDAGIEFFYGNHAWQMGLGVGLLSVYKNVVVVDGVEDIEKFSMLNVQIISKYFLYKGWFVGLDGGFAYSLSTIKTPHHPAAMANPIFPVVTVKTGYDFPIKGTPIIIGFFVETAHFFVNMSDNLDNGNRSYDASNWNIMPALEIAYSFE